MGRARSGEWVTRGALIGAMVSAGFGAAWALWGASGLDGKAAVAVAVVGVVVGLTVVGLGLRRMPSAPPDDASMFRARPYRLIVLVEFGALIAGSALLGATDHDEYVAVWYAAVVGAHFVAFGRTFWRGFMVIGGLLLVAAAAGWSLASRTEVTTQSSLRQLYRRQSCCWELDRSQCCNREEDEMNENEKPAGEGISDEEMVRQVASQTDSEHEQKDWFERESDGTTTDTEAAKADADETEG